MNSLPLEIITGILEYLSPSSRRQMRLINRKWYFASLHPSLIKNELITYHEQFSDCQKIKNSDIDAVENLKNIITLSERKLFNLKLCSINPSNNLTNFQLLKNNLVSLYLWDIYCLTDIFFETILECHNLEILELKKIGTTSINVKTRKKLLKLKRLDFDQINLTDSDFTQIILCTPNIIDIGFKDCHILEWPQAIKRFYPNYFSSIFKYFNSNDIFTPKNIVNNLVTMKNLKNLRLNQCCYIFLQLSQKLTIVSLILNLVSKQSYNKILLKEVLSTHISLINLEVYSLPYSLLSAVSKLHNLKSIKIILLTNPNDYTLNSQKVVHLNNFFISLCNFHHLKVFTLIPSIDHSLFPQAVIPDKILIKLISLDCFIDDCLKLTQLGSNLTNLRIRNGDILTVGHLQLIFTHLTKLRFLWIDKCHTLNDSVIIKSSSTLGEKTCIISNLKGAELTLEVLRTVKLLDLRELCISNITILECIKLKKFDEFDKSCKLLGQNVPDLVQLSLEILQDEARTIRHSNYEYFNPLLKNELIKSYFKTLKNVNILC
ncbi:uncharacterized protein LOC126894025 isoform X2 [Daktulosphaira vitifoliae]|uniref:uncharacterized protein LOC126894025 isoform X2 n=1 Tax=Daktulosphaira vitifoliae TaxID=58002 RepID=UPI0021AA06BE|nr:uncharacterized protein LOC126894025 isoform X2 [Daktulosphaira vitifoliae]